MSTLEDNLLVNQLPLDKWSLKEKLYLMSSICDFANPDWISVSELLIKMCASQNRPSDWFSKENCARQYNRIIEVQETTRLTESISNPSKPIVDSPDMILENLIDERVRELISEIQIAQEEYAVLCGDIKALQSMSNDHIQKMWCDIEKEQEMIRVEEMKLENQLREREKMKDGHLQNWNATVPKAFNLDASKSTNTSPVDMDVEEIVVRNGKSNLYANDMNSAMKIKSATSPLLSTLLKSSNPNFNNNSNINSVRCTAPTITNLLTGGFVANANHPAIIVTNDNVKLLTRPLSGPPVDNATNIQTKISTAQSAPTLSLLLEKSKNSKSSPLLESKTSKEIKTSKPQLSEEQLDDKVDLTKRKTLEKAISNEIGDTDATEEQQLLEVFKSIENIAELDIDVAAVINDEEEDFLKSVAEEPGSQLCSDSIIQREVKLDVESNNKSSSNDAPIHKPNSSAPEICDNTNYMQRTFTDCNAKQKKSACKNGSVSSSDSNDSIPLGKEITVEYLKEGAHGAEFMTKKEIEATKTCASDDSVTIDADKLKPNEKTGISLQLNNNIVCKMKTTNSIIETNEIKSLSLPSQNSPKIVKKEIVESKKDVGNTDGAMIDLYKIQENKFCNNNKTLDNTIENVELQVVSNVKQINNDGVSGEVKVVDIDPIELMNDDSSVLTTVITDMKAPSVGVDTNDDSSANDASIHLRKDEKLICGTKIPQSINATKIEDESSQLPFPPLAVTNIASRNNARKLRERDRSESPMVDDDTTNTSDYSTSQKLRRRYSSTPVLDSVPNSPASSDRDERELRNSKKTLLSIFNALYSSKQALSFQKVLNEVNLNTMLGEICLRPMDFQSIKKNIESGGIRTVYELQRDILLMCQNILMVIKTSSINYTIVQTFQKECQSIREFITNGCDTSIKTEREKSSHSSLPTTSKSRSGSRKSLRIS